MSNPHRKLLVLRLSSIGDILLTTPIIRSLKSSFPSDEIHFLTKPSYEPLIKHNPYLSQIHLFEGGLLKTIRRLRKENFDFIIDLHHNQRTFLIKLLLGVRSSAFPKLNAKKLLLTEFGFDLMPPIHIVDRYAAGVKLPGFRLDASGLDVFLAENWEIKANEWLAPLKGQTPIGVVLGATFATKKWPAAYYPQLLNALKKPVVLFGGKSEAEDADWIKENLEVPCVNLCGKTDLLESAGVLKKCEFVFANDTGLMHMAAAFGIKVYSFFGSTVPAFGMTPYKTSGLILQNEKLYCRPCSKLGHDACPKGHFRCMKEMTPAWVLEKIKAAE